MTQQTMRKSKVSTSRESMVTSISFPRWASSLTSSHSKTILILGSRTFTDGECRVRRKTGGQGGYAPPPPVPVNKLSTWDQRTLLEQQAVLNLASLTIPNPEIGDSKILIDALLVSPRVMTSSSVSAIRSMLSD